MSNIKIIVDRGAYPDTILPDGTVCSSCTRAEFHAVNEETERTITLRISRDRTKRNRSKVWSVYAVRRERDLAAHPFAPRLAWTRMSYFGDESMAWSCFESEKVRLIGWLRSARPEAA